MKQKFYLLFAFILFFSAAKSQESQTRFGVTAGLSIANWNIKASGMSIGTQSVTGFTGGVLAFMPLSSNISLQTGLNYVQKGTKVDDQGGDITTAKLNYIELPLNIVYNHEGFHIGAGPSVAMGLSGTMKSTSQGTTETSDVTFGSGDNDVARFDIGANLTAGYVLPSGFMLSANYNFGLSNLQPGTSSSDGKVTNRYFGIRIGYLFNK